MLGALVACGTPDGVEHAGAPGNPLDSVAAVILAEPDSAAIERVIRLLHARDGSWYVADNGSDRIVHFDPDGRFLATVGRHGRGPGEFEAPVDIVQLPGDTIAVADMMAQRITLFLNGRPDTAITVPSAPQSLVMEGDTGWIPGVNVSRATSLLRWDRHGNTFTPMAPVPADFTEGSSLTGVFSSGRAVAWADSVLLLLDGYAWARVLHTGGRVVDSFTVPARVRRGTPLDLAERLRQAQDFPAMFSAASGMFGAADVGKGWVALVHGDQDFDMSTRTIVNPRSYLTLLNRATHQACVDLPLPASGDVLPVPAFGHDTLYLLDRYVTDAGGLTTTVTSYQLHPDRCPDEAVMAF